VVALRKRRVVHLDGCAPDMGIVVVCGNRPMASRLTAMATSGKRRATVTPVNKLPKRRNVVFSVHGDRMCTHVFPVVCCHPAPMFTPPACCRARSTIRSYFLTLNTSCTLVLPNVSPGGVAVGLSV